MNVKILFAALALLLFTACNTNEQLVYLQHAGQPMPIPVMGQSAPVPDPVIKVGDLLVITINAATPEAAIPFNLPLVPTTGLGNYSPNRSTISSYSGGLQNYVVSADGNIELPIIGKIHAGGITKSELVEKIKSLIYPRYITEEPIILIRYANYHVSVLGEVSNPGNYIIDNDKVSILEALALAGDLTLYGRRDNILLIRETDSRRETVRIDLRDAALLESPYYFLQQGDVLYVQPNDPKSRSSALSSAENLSVSLIGTLISLTSLIVTFLK